MSLITVTDQKEKPVIINTAHITHIEKLNPVRDVPVNSDIWLSNGQHIWCAETLEVLRLMIYKNS